MNRKLAGFVMAAIVAASTSACSSPTGAPEGGSGKAAARPKATANPAPTPQPQARPFKTGQTECDQGNAELGPCPGTPAGQDGVFQKGVARKYRDNGDGTVSDLQTGLMWEKLSTDGSVHEKTALYTWKEAFAKVAALNADKFAGHEDWRLPNQFELLTLVDLTRFFPAVDPAFESNCVPGCTVLTCSCTEPIGHWSSTSYVGNPETAWIVHFGMGDVGKDHKHRPSWFTARAVRGG